MRAVLKQAHEPALHLRFGAFINKDDIRLETIYCLEESLFVGQSNTQYLQVFLAIQESSNACPQQ